ncbi:hypothetical protein HDU76_001120 [Blyttiomyces sp. JEL0837]|nr:hypothetical protein HDU76_001120 [Blyttiomyces sp. JEL0837]
MSMTTNSTTNPKTGLAKYDGSITFEDFFSQELEFYCMAHVSDKTNLLPYFDSSQYPHTVDFHKAHDKDQQVPHPLDPSKTLTIAKWDATAAKTYTANNSLALLALNTHVMPEISLTIRGIKSASEAFDLLFREVQHH